MSKPTDKVALIFSFFVEANNLIPHRNFGKPAAYSGIGSQQMTEEEIRATPDFAAFVDGITDRQSRAGGIETVDISQGNDIGSRVAGASIGKEARTIVLDATHNRQYELGKTYRAKYLVGK